LTVIVGPFIRKHLACRLRAELHVQRFGGTGQDRVAALRQVGHGWQNGLVGCDDNMLETVAVGHYEDGIGDHGSVGVHETHSAP